MQKRKREYFKKDINLFNVPVVYMARAVMILMAEKSISRAIGRGGP